MNLKGWKATIPFPFFHLFRPELVQFIDANQLPQAFRASEKTCHVLRHLHFSCIPPRQAIKLHALLNVTKVRLLDWMAQIPPRIRGIQRTFPDSQTLKEV